MARVRSSLGVGGIGAHPPARAHLSYKDAVLGVSLGEREVSRNSPRRGTKPKVPERFPSQRRCKQRLYAVRRRSADCASPFASALLSRGTCEMENFSERASFRQVQCKEYSRGLRQVYSPVICLTTTSESEYTWSLCALRDTAYCSASISAAYSATLLSWRPIHLAMRTGPLSQPLITTPMPDGPGFPRQPPST